MNSISDIELLIDECEVKANSPNLSNKVKLEAVNTIFQVKLTADKTGYYNELYRDAKRLIILYLCTIDDRKFEYDLVNRSYLSSIFSIFDLKERLALYNFLIRQLKKHEFESDLNYFISDQKHCELKLLTKIFPKKGFKLITCFITLNLWTILLTILISYSIYFTILLPANSSVVLYEIRYKDISKNFWMNHFCNTLLGILDLNSSEFITPVNVTGVILAIIGKIIFILLILKICIDKFIDTFKSTF